MNSKIKPGDLVMVVRPNLCCGDTSSIGSTGIAEENPSWGLYAECDGCGDIDFNIQNYITISGGGYHLATLKKIDPPALDVKTEHSRELESA